MKISKIRIYRAKFGYSQKDLAERVGVTKQTINLIEGGKFNPTLKICKGVCNALDASLEELFGNDNYTD